MLSPLSPQNLWVFLLSAFLVNLKLCLKPRVSKSMSSLSVEGRLVWLRLINSAS